MSQIIEIELPSKRTIQAEVTAPVGTFQEMAVGDTIRRKLTDIADELRETVSVVADKLDGLGPDKVTIEVSMEIGTNGALKFFGADAKSGLKISLSWDKKTA